MILKQYLLFYNFLIRLAVRLKIYYGIILKIVVHNLHYQAKTYNLKHTDITIIPLKTYYVDLLLCRYYKTYIRYIYRISRFY